MTMTMTGGGRLAAETVDRPYLHALLHGGSAVMCVTRPTLSLSLSVDLFLLFLLFLSLSVCLFSNQVLSLLFIALFGDMKQASKRASLHSTKTNGSTACRRTRRLATASEIKDRPCLLLLACFCFCFCFGSFLLQAFCSVSSSSLFLSLFCCFFSLAFMSIRCLCLFD
mmetsp:Transcript_7823/g.15524  ORF Transcript_7823/g.15524 Transcript_7823/m.15524 type:complete len:168 (-) Transcript_7823:330-833(-)